METLGRGAGGSVALAVTSAGAAGASVVPVEAVVSVEAVTSGAAGGCGASWTGGAMGDREASNALSLTRLDESEPHPPRMHARTATTRTCGQTPELERT